MAWNERIAKSVSKFDIILVVRDRLMTWIDSVDFWKLVKWLFYALLGLLIAVTVGYRLSPHFEQNWVTLTTYVLAFESICVTIYAQLNDTTAVSSFEEWSRIAGEESADLEEYLRLIKSQNRSKSAFIAVANVLEMGLKYQDNQTFELLVSEFEKEINAKKYLNRYGRERMKVVQFEDDTLHVNSEDTYQYLKKGFRFTIFLKTAKLVDGEAKSVERPIGSAEIVLVSPNVTKLKMHEWGVDKEEEAIKELVNNNLDDKEVMVEFDVHNDVENVDLTTLEEVYEGLREIEQKRRVQS